MRKYKEQVFSYDEKELKNYFELEATLGGMFRIAEILF
jgi:Zn-dependent oligopeptidase